MLKNCRHISTHIIHCPENKAKKIKQIKQNFLKIKSCCQILYTSNVIKSENIFSKKDKRYWEELKLSPLDTESPCERLSYWNHYPPGTSHRLQTQLRSTDFWSGNTKHNNNKWDINSCLVHRQFCRDHRISWWMHSFINKVSFIKKTVFKPISIVKY